VHFKLSLLGSGFKFGFYKFNDFVPMSAHTARSQVEHVLRSFFAPALA
jgi:hypothetical protein